MGLLRQVISSAIAASAGAAESKSQYSGRLRLSRDRTNGLSDEYQSAPCSYSERNYVDSTNHQRDDYSCTSFRHDPAPQVHGVDNRSDQPNQCQAKQDSPGMLTSNNGHDISPPAEEPPRYIPREHDSSSYSGPPPGSIIRGFSPLILPQIENGHGSPFLRGYSQQLLQYNISMDMFIQFIDQINIVIIPNPENQIFQKAANIAGFFLPGASGIGLTVGQIAVGLGASAHHRSRLSSVLADANSNLFLPCGLEACIATSEDIDFMLGIIPNTSRRAATTVSSPLEKLASYQGLTLPLSQVLPPLQQNGRSDPIAVLGRGINSKNNKKKLVKAQKKMQKGRSSEVESLEAGLKWLIVRQSNANARC